MSDLEAHLQVEEDEWLAEHETSTTLSLSRKQLRVFMSYSPITLAIAGIRGGKTHVGALKMLFFAMANPCAEDECHLVCSPTYQMSRVPMEKLFKLLYDKTIFPVCPLIRYVKGERMFVLAANGGGITRIIVRSLHDPDRLRGLKAKSAWIDEGAYVDSYAWEVVQGRLADSAGPCWVTTTPAGYNWVYDLYEQARRGDRDIVVVHWESTENTYINQDGIQRLARRFDHKAHEQEVRARFVRGRGLVYYAFNRMVHGRPCIIDPRRPLYVGQDFNVDPMASVLAQPFTTLDGQEGLHACYVRKVPDSGTAELVRFLDAFIAEHGIAKSNVRVYPDAAGQQRSTSGKSDFRILRDAQFKVDAPARNPFIKDRVNCVNGLFAPMHSKHPRLLVDLEECAPLVEGLEKQIWKPESDPPTPDKTHGFDHANDALGYMCWRRYPLRNTTSLGKGYTHEHSE